MRKLISISFCLGILLLGLGLLRAEGEKRASPHEQVLAVIGGKKITIEYGRPYKKGRKIFGELVPWGQVWRAGADEATTLTTDGDITIGNLKLAKGVYSLFTVPGQKEWQLAVNKVSKQWGAYSYDQKQDLGRTAMKVSQAAAPVEQFTIALTPDADKTKKTGTLTMSWDTTVASVPVAAQ